MMLSRRGVLRCLTGIIAAPAVIKAGALMRVVATPRRLTEEEIDLLIRPPIMVTRTSIPAASWRALNLVDVTNLDPRLVELLFKPLLPAEHSAERAVPAGFATA